MGRCTICKFRRATAMSRYGEFAYVYDQLMADVPYDDWAEFFNQQVAKAKTKPDSILDLACGTGELSVRFAQEGFSVVGVDLSDDMLMVAQEKAAEAGLTLSLFQQNMAELELLKEFDCVVIFCDSLNYLQSDKEVQETIQRVYKHLKPGGLFIFDVHSVHKMKDVFGNQSFSYVDEDVSYIWNCTYDDTDTRVEHDITFFAYNEEMDAYHRFDEVHAQRTWSIDHYQSWLSEAGFINIAVSADFKMSEPTSNSERIFFSAQKKEAE